MKLPAKHKYHAIKETVDGHVFPSRSEARRYCDLKLLQTAGIISDLKLQPEFPIVIDGRPLRIRGKRGIGKPIIAIMDFEYIENGVKIIEDRKGMDVRYSRIKRALVEHLYGIEIRVTEA